METLLKISQLFVNIQIRKHSKLQELQFPIEQNYYIHTDNVIRQVLLFHHIRNVSKYFEFFSITGHLLLYYYLEGYIFIIKRKYKK